MFNEDFNTKFLSCVLSFPNFNIVIMNLEKKIKFGKLSFRPLPILGQIKNVCVTFDLGKVTFRISKIITTVEWCNKSSELYIFCVKFERFQGFLILKKRTTKVICSSKKFV